MASRPAFLKREPWASPKVPPAKRPPTRRAPTRDPRVTPWRPAPKAPKITPNGPLFPGAPKPKYPVFGKRPPFIPLAPTLPGKLRPLLPFLRLHPLIGFGLLAWQAYDLYQWWQEMQAADAKWSTRRKCIDDNPLRQKHWRWARYDGCFSYQPGSINSIPPRPTGVNGEWLQMWQQAGTDENPSTTRFDTVEQWRYGNNIPVGTIPRPLPVFTLPSVNLPPDELPYPYPYAPPQLPITPPLTRPQEEGQPSQQPQARPAPRPVRPPGLVAPIPAIEWRPGTPAISGYHERRPPTEREREKKKRLKPGTSAAWLSFMDRTIGAYTEVDDVVSALYKGLPWKLRRWRGRDGVWRDRDIRSDTRAKRLYELLGSLDVQKGIEEIIKNQLSDAAFGAVGNRLKNRARELGDEGLWGGNTGFQQGGANRSDTWEEAYQKLKKEQAGRVKYRQYTVREQQADGTWRYVKKQRPVTQIPWYQQQSRYNRMARPGMSEWWELTAAEKAARKKTVRGYYYAPTPSDRPLYY